VFKDEADIFLEILAHATFFLNIIEINGTFIKLVQSNTREKYDGIRNGAQELAQHKWARNKFDIKTTLKTAMVT